MGNDSPDTRINWVSNPHMFDVGFSELVLIGIIALLVLGPERLPKVARTAGLWAGRARRFISSVKSDIEQELKAEELRQIMKEQAKSSGIHEIIEETKSDLEEISKSEYLVKATPKSPSAPVSEKPTQQQPTSSGTDHDNKA
jgi:sec-independent protein translocase protein TatB